jgi:hypothetical protein
VQAVRGASLHKRGRERSIGDEDIRAIKLCSAVRI